MLAVITLGGIITSTTVMIFTETVLSDKWKLEQIVELGQTAAMRKQNFGQIFSTFVYVQTALLCSYDNAQVYVTLVQLNNISPEVTWFKFLLILSLSNCRK